MPITFAQPDPLVPQLTASAAAAESAAKAFPTIAQIYESAAKLRASGGGGGFGGGGGRNGGGGGIQVLPNGDGGAMYQVQAQANREQRAMDLGYEAQMDPVAHHIEMQQNFRQQQTQQEQQRQDETIRRLNPSLLPQNRGNGPTPQPVEQSIVFSPSDQKQLNSAGQIMSDITDDLADGNISPDVAYSIHSKYESEFNRLTQKQQAAQEQAQQKQAQAQMQQAQQQAGLQAATGNALARHAVSLDDIPGMPRGMLAMDKAGKLYDPTEHRAKLAADIWKTQQGKILSPEQIVKMKQDAEIHESKYESLEMDKYIKRRQLVENRWDKENDSEKKDFMKANKDNPKAEWKDWPPEDRDNEIARIMRAKGQAGTVDEFLQQHKASRTGQSQPRAGGLQQTAPPNQEDRKLMKEANPEALTSFKSHVSELPRTQSGQVDLDSASIDQLRTLNDYYSRPKAIGVSKEAADAVRARINDAVQARNNRKPMATPPVPKDSAALGRVYDAVGQIPNTDQDLGNGGHYVGGPPSTQLGRRMREAVPSWDAVKGFFTSKNPLGIGQ